MYGYRTVAGPVRAKIAVGACRFYASLSPCENESKARLFIERVKEQLPGATHHAWAFRVGAHAQVLARCDDDGEPAGTAGLPLMGVVEKADLTNVVLVGTRFFGGVKLGIGGLIRAYRACGEAGVAAAAVSEKELTARLEVTVPYIYLGAVEQEVRTQAGEVLRHSFDQQAALEIIVPLRILDTFSDRMVSLSRGVARLRRL